MNNTPSKSSAETKIAFLPLLMRNLRAAFGAVLRMGRQVSLRRRESRMRLCETLSLGDKRFLALVVVEQEKFLVGGAPNSISLLAKLPAQAGASQFSDEVHLL
jgi:flagellar biogenesis protein FliO